MDGRSIVDRLVERKRQRYREGANYGKGKIVRSSESGRQRANERLDREIDKDTKRQGEREIENSKIDMKREHEDIDKIHR